jgi:hypothetical protein
MKISLIISAICIVVLTLAVAGCTSPQPGGAVPPGSPVVTTTLPAPSGRGDKWPTLTQLHVQLFETEFTDSHKAGADVEACAKCYFELRRRGIIE